MPNNNFHKDFKLNENSFSSVLEILDYTKTNSSKIYLFLEKWFDSSEYIIVKTSGSTGKPKSLKLKKEHMLNSAIATGKYFNLKEKTTALLCLSTDFIAGKMMLVRAMVLGWHLDIVEPSSNPLNKTDKFYDFTAMVPLQLFNSLKKIKKIKTLIVGGGVVTNNLQSKILDLPTRIFATYGMTETITHIAIKPLNKSAGLTSENDFYQTLPYVNISSDERNCLVIDAPKISEERFITNDIVELIPDDKFKWLGRYDNIINSGGVKLIPEQIEGKLSQIISQRFFVIGIPDEVLGEKLILIIEGCVQNNLKSQISNLKSIDKFDVPKEIYFIDNFVETETKKIQRDKTLDLLKI